MRVDLFDINQFIKENKCKEVANSIFFNPDGNPTDEGLFSYEIFGTTDEERKNIFGYIDLHDYFIHPFVFSIFPRMGSIGKIVSGEKYAVIANKKIQIVPKEFQGAETGISFFYDHFNEIDWFSEMEEETTDSADKKIRYKFLKSLKKEEFFVNKWLVIPPFYRTQSSTNRTLGDQINQLYKDLISKTKSMKLGFSFSLFGDETKIKIQNLLKQIYLSSLSPLSGKHIQKDGELKGTPKNSMVRKHLLGKTIDYSASNVITAPQVSLAQSSKDNPVPFGYGRFPMASLLAIFQPFFSNGVSKIMERYLEIFRNEFFNEIKKIDVSQFSPTEVDKLIKRFIKTESERFAPISFQYTNKKGEKVSRDVELLEFFKEEDAKEGKNFNRRTMTLADLFYIVGKDVLSEKHVYVTRYPVINFQNIYPSKIKIATTKITSPRWILSGFSGDPAFYDDYPSIPEKPEKVLSKNVFIDVMVIGNLVLNSLGADYDGDMVYMKGVFSIEANKEAERLIYSKTNLLNVSGEPSRGVAIIGKEAVISLYELTKEGS